jgi:hypothetical protein
MLYSTHADPRASLLTGICAYHGYNVSLKRNGPVPTSASICLTPVYAAAQAMLLIGGKLACVALVLVVVGLLLVNRAQASPTGAVRHRGSRGRRTASTFLKTCILVKVC